MTTATATRTTIKPTWTAQKTQEAIARAFAVQCMTTCATLSKYGEAAQKEQRDAIHKAEAEHLKSMGVQTPWDLVKAKAEFETNAFGSQIEIAGDENSAQLIYNQCAMWNAMEKYGKITPEQKEKMLPNFQACISEFAQEFGFKGNVQVSDGKATLTFSK
jgi:uncharacterized membrane protein YqiK